MTTVNVFTILSKVFGARGLPFPGHPKKGEGEAIAPLGKADVAVVDNKSTRSGSLIRKYDDSHLGTYQFLPAYILYGSDLKYCDLPNAVVIISGDKEIVETTIVDVGTVFEQVFVRPYSISILVTLIGDKNNWPEDKIKEIKDLWDLDSPVTLKCALTDVFLQGWDNFIIKKISLLDNRGAENVEVIQIDGMSNINFELELI